MQVRSIVIFVSALRVLENEGVRLDLMEYTEYVDPSLL
jgi:hypothetical protein